MSRSEAHEVLRWAVSRSESQEGLHQTEFESQEDIRLARYQDQPAPLRKRKISKVLLGAFGVSCQVEFTTAAEVAPLKPLADSQGPEAAAVAEGAVAITVASARPQGLGGGPAQAYHYRQPLANTKEATVMPPRGMAISTSLRMRRLRDGCSKLCFSPIGAVLGCRFVEGRGPRHVLYYFISSWPSEKESVRDPDRVEVRRALHVV